MTVHTNAVRAGAATPAGPASSPSGQPSRDQPAGALAAVQAALAAEHAAVYGYGVVGARLTGRQRDQARAALDAHRARRDELERTARDLGGQPEAAAPAYALPFSVTDAAGAVRLAAVMEDRVAAVYADTVRELRGTLRAEAARALSDSAVRAVGWRGRSVAFPGLTERARDGAGRDVTSPPPDAL